MNTINDINNLKFFTDQGYEIETQKSYVLTWEIIPSQAAQNDVLNPSVFTPISQKIKEHPKGYFIGDISVNSEHPEETPEVINLQAFANDGKIVIPSDSLGIGDEYNYVEDIKRMLSEDDTNVKISINIHNKSYSRIVKFSRVFSLDQIISLYPFDYVLINKVSIGNAIDSTDSGEVYYEASIKKLDLVYDNDKPVVQKIFEENINNLWQYFPFIRYTGVFYQEPCSSGFVNANTLIVYEKEGDKYVRPHLENGGNFHSDSEFDQYSLSFQPEAGSEISLISSDSKYNVEYVPNISFSLTDDKSTQPMHFAFGFQANMEGLYNNYIGINLKTQEMPDMDFFMGVISVNTEVIGEDERFRTLLGNFGIPDPKEYSNLFFEQDYQEEGKDFKLINKKSKELFLSYDKIFSYIGTYKALLNAIKFLGYSDIVFKEWYTILDSNDDLTDIAVQVFDTNTGEFLKSKLAQYGVSIEDFKRYNKINKLSMIYHLNQINDKECDEVTQYLIDGSTHNVSTYESNPNVYKTRNITDVPVIDNIYEYRTDEILAKLYSVKKWLEYHIIGVGAYISDITGEGVYIYPSNTQAYVTEHHLADFSSEQYYTPNVIKISDFKNSSAILTCTLNEIKLNKGLGKGIEDSDGAITFADYEHTPIEAFSKGEIPVCISQKYINSSNIEEFIIYDSTLYITNTIEIPVLGDEYEFNLKVTPDSGTLCEWFNTSDDYTQMFITDGEIKLLKDDKSEALIDTSCNLPIITLENANIRPTFGKYNSNISYHIREGIDPITGNVLYRLTDVSNNLQYNETYYYILKPTSDNAYFKYTEKNDYRLPIIILNGYSLYYSKNNVEPLINIDDDIALEIIKGDVLFKQNDSVAAQLSFSDENMQNEQTIKITYTYFSDRKPFIEVINSSIYDASNDIHSEIINNNLLYNLQKKFRDDLCDKFIDSSYCINTSAYENASNYLIDINYITDVSKFIEKINKAKISKELYEKYVSAYNNKVTSNLYIDASVTRLGNYEVFVKAYDKYGNLYVNKNDKEFSIKTKPIDIKTYVFQENSNNNYNFYKNNTNGTLIDFNLLRDNIDETYEFPKNYKISDFTYENDIIEFENMSYAIDTPKNNDYVIFQNFPEQVKKIHKNLENNTYTIEMYHSNDEIHLYDNFDNKSIVLYVYDKVHHILESEYQLKGNISYSDFSIIVNIDAEDENEFNNIILKLEDDSYDVYALNTTIHSLGESIYSKNLYYVYRNNDITKYDTFKNYIDCSISQYDENQTLDITYKLNNEYLTKSIDASKFIYINDSIDYLKSIYVINSDSEFDNFNKLNSINNNSYVSQIRNNDNYTCDIVLNRDSNDSYMFNTNDVVKIRITLLDNNLDEKVFNETCYRILDASLFTFDNDMTCQKYTLNGWINTQFLNDSYFVNISTGILPSINRYSVKFEIMYANLSMVKYKSQIINDGYEYYENIGYNGALLLKDKFRYNSKQLFLNDYIDNTYVCYVANYDDDNLKSLWFDKNILNSSVNDIYEYINHPITIKKKQEFLITYDSSQNILNKDNLHIEWQLSSNLINIDDMINKNAQKNIIFKSINNYLSLKTYEKEKIQDNGLIEYVKSLDLLGPQDIQLECIDKYGNRVINPGEGLIYIKNED